VSNSALVDCAHNAEGLRATVKQLEALGRPLRILFATVADKELKLIWPLLPQGASYHFCAAEMPRALSSEKLLELASVQGLIGVAHKSVEDAVQSARNAQTGDELLVVLGSIFIAGPALVALGAPID
jgi:dihydrofolate synthase/folylpolyglutamate synthase